MNINQTQNQPKRLEQIPQTTETPSEPRLSLTSLSQVANLPTQQLEDRVNESMLTKNFSISMFCVKQRKKPMKWTDQDTKTFYKCLEVFGTDFAMIKEVLSHLTPRQIARKFHKEKKRNPQFVEAALQVHQANLISKDSKSSSFLENLFIQTVDSDPFSDNNSDVSLEEAINYKLKLINEQGEDYGLGFDDEPLYPLEFYLKD